MAKPTGGLLAFGASGTLAKTMVYSSWRGRSYVRRHVVPANPKSAGQTDTREVFATLALIWKNAPALVQDVWTLAAKGRPLTNRNLFNRANITNLRSQTDMTNLSLSQGGNAGLAISTITPTPGSGQLSIALTEPTLPAGWSLVDYIAAAIKDHDPHSATDVKVHAAQNATSPVVITGLTGSALYQVRAWAKFTKPDGTTAYGPELATTATPS